MEFSSDSQDEEEDFSHLFKKKIVRSAQNENGRAIPPQRATTEQVPPPPQPAMTDRVQNVLAFPPQPTTTEQVPPPQPAMTDRVQNVRTFPPQRATTEQVPPPQPAMTEQVPPQSPITEQPDRRTGTYPDRSL